MLIFPSRHRDPSAAELDHSEATNYGQPAGVRLEHFSLTVFQYFYVVFGNQLIVAGL